MGFHRLERLLHYSSTFLEQDIDKKDLIEESLTLVDVFMETQRLLE